MQTTLVKPDYRSSQSEIFNGRGEKNLTMAMKDAAIKNRNSFAPASGNGQRALVEALSTSKIYQDYERAFSEATGLPMSLRPVESWQLPLHGKRHRTISVTCSH
jgi:hypothetical protein